MILSNPRANTPCFFCARKRSYHMAEGAKGTATDVYLLDVGEAAAARLRLLDQVYGASTRRMLLEAGLREGSRVLDLACGVGAVSCWLASQVGATGKVIAGDVNPDQLVVAKWHCAKCDHPAPIEYMEANAYDTGLASGSFDIVHMRLLLCHLTDPLKVLIEAYRLLKRGGALVCQDLRLSSIFCSPESSAYTRWVQLGHALGAKLGVDYDFGVRLPAAAAQTGFRSIQIHLEQPAYLRGPEKRLWEHTFAEASPVAVRNGVATEDELKDLLHQMRETADDETVLIAQACLPGVVAIK
jgi:2-polyprenyl-3-methyl-5-hydroxy-6-metoxy-1,4-benzoquinol methylase